MQVSSLVRLLTLALTTFTGGLAEFILIGQLDLVSTGLHVSESTAGQLVTVFALGYAIFAPVLIAGSARLDRRLMLVSGLLLFAAANLVSAIPGLTPSFSAFTAVRIGMAAIAGAVVVTSLSLVGRVIPGERQGSGLATVLMGFTAALVLGVPWAASSPRPLDGARSSWPWRRSASSTRP